MSERVYDQRTKACALCGSRERRHVLEGWEQRFSTPGTFRIARCETCGLMFQEPIPAREEIEKFCEIPHSGHMHSRLFDGHASLVNASRARFLCAHKPPGRLLDIGCGTGDFLQQARKREWDVSGVEMSANACRIAAERLGGGIYKGDLVEIELPPEWFDAVTLWHVFEHITSPNELLQAISRVNTILRFTTGHKPFYIWERSYPLWSGYFSVSGFYPAAGQCGERSVSGYVKAIINRVKNS